MLGWRAVLLDELSDATVAALLGVDRDDGCHELERETPDLLLAVFPCEAGANDTHAANLDRLAFTEAVARIAAGSWKGKANRLSEDHVDWKVIREIEKACEKPETESLARTISHPDTSVSAPASGLSALRIIQQRRSAVAMDGETNIDRGVFYRMLHRVVPSCCPVPWDVGPSLAHVHLGIFVHRVDGIPPGLYALVRESSAVDALRSAMNPSFAWTTPEKCPGELPLYLLADGDCRQTATAVSCGQDIAGDSAFSLGMFAAFEPVIRERGAWMYRRLFWETGTIGQVLYLEAEAAGIRSTGIGCFFDDPVHEIFGITDGRFQSLYHFTVGGPVEDARLTTGPPYPR